MVEYWYLKYSSYNMGPLIGGPHVALSNLENKSMFLCRIFKIGISPCPT